MKKNAAPARIETTPAKTLFGIASDKLKAVNGGGGVIVHGDGSTSSTTSSTLTTG
jgi:hypothetical protein